MRRLLTGVVGFVCLLISHPGTAQPQYAFRVSFTDKKGAPPLADSATYLSARAINRRAAQALGVDSVDRPVSRDYIDSVLTLTAGKLHLTSKWLNTAVILLNDSAQMLQLQGRSYIKETRYIGYYTTPLHKSKSTSPALPKKTTGTEAYYGQAFQQTTIVNGDFLHDRGYKGEGMLIAIMDEGFKNIDNAIGFDSMNANGRLIDRYDFVTASSTINVAANHGTNALSIMAGNIPGTFVGSAPNASYAVYCTEIGPTEQYLELDNMVAAIERADSLGADVVTASLGYNWFSGPASPNFTYADVNGSTTVVARAANIATTKGILFVASAGNEGGNSWNVILTPGDADSAITIGAADAGKNVISSSGWGPNSSGRRKPDVCMPAGPGKYLQDGNVVNSGSATSWATPQLAGWAACLWQAAGPATTPFQLKQAIIKSAHLYDNPNNHDGYGVPDFAKALNELLSVPEAPGIPDNRLQIVPNPADDRITLNLFLTQPDNVVFRVTDVAGRLVYDATTHLDSGTQQVNIPTDAWASGVYLLKAKINDKTMVGRVVKR